MGVFECRVTFSNSFYPLRIKKQNIYLVVLMLWDISIKIQEISLSGIINLEMLLYL